uniref:Uncharacterized protein n=1 Tax=Vibrio parahaemolyticus TaxID=670 RepID=A0A0C5GWW6_VIBPH|nr:hypothetical protein pVPH1_0021 [Vibrio parahaemolyticus]
MNKNSLSRHKKHKRYIRNFWVNTDPIQKLVCCPKMIKGHF